MQSAFPDVRALLGESGARAQKRRHPATLLQPSLCSGSKAPRRDSSNASPKSEEPGTISNGQAPSPELESPALVIEILSD